MAWKILTGVLLGILEFWLIRQFWRLELETRHAFAIVTGVTMLISGSLLVVVWIQTQATGRLKWRGVVWGFASICGGAMALLWAGGATGATNVAAVLAAALSLGALAIR